MAVSDLTNTTWVFDDAADVKTAADYVIVSYNINFTSNNSNYTLLKFDNDPIEPEMFYNTLGVYSANNSEGIYWWDAGEYKVIEITGGTDVTNATLIAWLEANATQITISDLTNTTWLLNNSFALPQNLDISYAINFTSNNNTFKNIYLDDDYGEDNFMISYYTADNQTIYVYDSFDGGWTNQAYRTIEITGGTDVTNATLISWLEAHATQQGGGSTGTVLKIYSNDERATAYDIYVQGGTYVTPTKLATVQRTPTPSGYNITCTIQEYYIGDKQYLRFYDGQDSSGTLLYESTGTVLATSPLTLTSTTGYIYVTTVVQTWGNFELSNAVNCTLSEVVTDAAWLITFTDNNATCIVYVAYAD